MVLYNFEKRIIPVSNLITKLGIKSSYTLYCIREGRSYQDYALKYKKLNEEQKSKLASLLRD